MAVSEWAARCPSCDSDLADAIVVEDWDAALARSRRRVNSPHGLQRRSGRIGAGIALLAATVAVVLVAGRAARHNPLSDHQVICATPTSTWSPTTPTQVGAPGAAKVGPLTFHPAYLPDPSGPPTRVILHSVEDIAPGLTMTGWNCGTGQALRFWYPPYGDDGELPKPVSQAPAQGELTVTVPRLASGNDLIGYMLFPKAGRWDVEVWRGNSLVGNIVFALPGRGQ
jgi:hypothetical protein